MLRRCHHFLFYKVLFKWKMDSELHQYLCSIYEDDPMSFHKDLFIWLIGGWDWNKLLPAESSWYKLLSHNSPISWISWSYSRSWSYHRSMLLCVKFPYITCPSYSSLPNSCSSFKNKLRCEFLRLLPDSRLLWVQLRGSCTSFPSSLVISRSQNYFCVCLPPRASPSRAEIRLSFSFPAA